MIDLRFNKSGFSTVELLVAVAILAIVIAAGATLAQVADRSTNYPDRKIELLSLASHIAENLRNERTCTSALAGNNLVAGRSNGNGRGNAFGHINQGLNSPNGRKVSVEIANLRLESPTPNIWNPDAPATERQILSRRLQINDISLRQGKLIDDSTVPKVYLANAYLEAEEIGGMSFKPVLLGTITLYTDANDEISTCQGVASSSLQQACEGTNGMGCVWDPQSQPNCRCLLMQEVCAAPGYYPTSFEIRGNETFARPVCTPLGGGSCAGADEYLVGVGLGQTHCAPVPTTCPTGTSQGGAGNPVAGLIRCRCDNANETYIQGSGCLPAAQQQANCPARRLSWTLNSNTCEADFGQQGASTISLAQDDITAPTTGRAAFACDAQGSWSATPEAGASCNTGNQQQPIRCHLWEARTSGQPTCDTATLGYAATDTTCSGRTPHIAGCGPKMPCVAVRYGDALESECAIQGY